MNKLIESIHSYFPLQVSDNSSKMQESYGLECVRLKLNIINKS